jgi:hypothetical protein
MTMVCENCGQTGIRWMGRFSSGLTHTECPHCGGTNCQIAEQAPEDDEFSDPLEYDHVRANKPRFLRVVK